MPPPATLLDRVERRIPELARTLLSTFTTAVPAYRHLPGEQLDGEITAVVTTNLSLLVACLQERRGPRPEELAEPQVSAARRAEERVPLDQVLTAYSIGARMVWDALEEEATEEEQPQLATFAPLILGCLGDVTAVVARAYVDEQATVVGEERDARRQLTESLLTTGDAPAALAERAGVTPSRTYRAVALRFGPSPDEGDPSVSPTVAGRRKVRRATEAIEALVGAAALTVLDANGGAAALDLPDPAIAHQLLTDAIGADVWLAVTEPVTPPGLPAAWQQARDVRRLTAVMARPPGVWTVEDVLLERTLSADPAAVERLAEVLAPLEEKEELLRTVEAWYECDFDRRAAATALTIHPNTLDYRLRRVAELIGHDLATAGGTQLIGAALLARKLSA